MTTEKYEELCGCPRQGDLWLCDGRPQLEHTPDGYVCELGEMLNSTGSDWWPSDREYKRRP